MVLANKIDIEPHISEIDVIKGLNLDYVIDNPWIVFSISALYGTNFEQIVTWLLKKARDRKK